MAPIIGVTDLESDRLPRLGKIKLGLPPGPGKPYPSKTDYFVCPPQVIEIYGAMPTALPVVLPFNDINRQLTADLKQYGSERGRICVGDGKEAMRVHPQTGELRSIICKYKECPDYRAKKCQEKVTLIFLLPQVPGVGVWWIETTSLPTYWSLRAEMQLIQRVMHGRLAGVPLILTLEPEERIYRTEPDSSGKVARRKTTVYSPHLRSQMTFEQLISQPSLPAPDSAWVEPGEGYEEPPLDFQDAEFISSQVDQGTLAEPEERLCYLCEQPMTSGESAESLVCVNCEAEAVGPTEDIDLLPDQEPDNPVGYDREQLFPKSDLADYDEPPLEES